MNTKNNLFKITLLGLGLIASASVTAMEQTIVVNKSPSLSSIYNEIKCFLNTRLNFNESNIKFNLDKDENIDFEIPLTSDISCSNDNASNLVRLLQAWYKDNKRRFLRESKKKIATFEHSFCTATMKYSVDAALKSTEQTVAGTIYYRNRLTNETIDGVQPELKTSEMTSISADKIASAQRGIVNDSIQQKVDYLIGAVAKFLKKNNPEILSYSAATLDFFLLVQANSQGESFIHFRIPRKIEKPETIDKEMKEILNHFNGLYTKHEEEKCNLEEFGFQNLELAIKGATLKGKLLVPNYEQIFYSQDLRKARSDSLSKRSISNTPPQQRNRSASAVQPQAAAKVTSLFKKLGLKDKKDQN